LQSFCLFLTTGLNAYWFSYGDKYCVHIQCLKAFGLIKIIIKEENFKWHLEAFVSELFIYKQ